MSEILSDNDRMYYRTGLKKILHALRDGQKHYTHHFEQITCFSGKDNRPLLRKCLRTLEADGLVQNFDQGYNIHMWQITDKGKEQLKNET